MHCDARACFSLTEHRSSHAQQFGRRDRDPSSLQSKFIHECAFTRSNHSDVSFIIPAYQPVCGFHFGFFFFLFLFFKQTAELNSFPSRFPDQKPIWVMRQTQHAAALSHILLRTLWKTLSPFLSKNIITVM